VSARLRFCAALAALLVGALAAAACGDGGGAETDAAHPGGDDETLIGFNEAITPGDDGAGTLIADSGASFVRVALNWATVEPSEGNMNWDAYDAINEELTGAGLKPLWTVTSAPCWAAGKTCAEVVPSLAPDSDHIQAYADLVAEVAERYPDSLGIEVWNEPNIPNFWRPAPDPMLYREMLALSADAVHETGTGVPVLMSGPSPTTADQVAEDPEKIGFVPFIEQVMSGPDAPDVDAIGLHPYSLLQVGADPVDESLKLFEQGKEAAASVAPDLPIWVTEVGLTTAGQYAVTPEEQASGLEAIVGAIADDGVPVISIHRFFDQVDPPLQFEEGFGVVGPDRQTPKPSFCSAADAVGADCEP
jgi:polysaccharide biosynthesis protein PslG